MYQPAHHREDRLEVQHGLIESHSFGLLISSGTEGLLANALPFLLQRMSGPLGTLRAHMARGNAQWRGLDGQKVLTVFQGPQAYVSPSFYATKRETGKVVPTWNYAMVQARGVARLRTEARSEPVSGSLMPMQKVSSPLAMRGTMDCLMRSPA